MRALHASVIFYCQQLVENAHGLIIGEEFKEFYQTKGSFFVKSAVQIYQAGALQESKKLSLRIRNICKAKSLKAGDICKRVKSDDASCLAFICKYNILSIFPDNRDAKYLILELEEIKGDNS
ncbi:hypothetical protein [Bartonella sp. DGB1]|uniref:hypothetical protein n=1 Tax=Bartonella sp. DGB1 TaxID=3239807 RepID=UPI00352388AB